MFCRYLLLFWLCSLSKGYEVFVEFCPTEDEGSGTGNETELLSPISEEKEEEEEEIVACVTQNHAVGPDTLFLVVTYPPDFNHNLTYSVSQIHSLTECVCVCNYTQKYIETVIIIISGI